MTDGMTLQYREPKNCPLAPCDGEKRRQTAKPAGQKEACDLLNNRDRGEKIKGFQSQQMDTLKNTVRSCELSESRGKLSDRSPETAVQRSLRNFPKDIGERSVYT